jgi:hypothetical protein
VRTFRRTHAARGAGPARVAAPVREP